MGHGIDVCVCGAVVRQCRCLGPHERRVVQMSCAKCIDAPPSMVVNVQRLLLIEEQAKRVARAGRWYEWASQAWELDKTQFKVACEAGKALVDERRKLAEMVGEGN